MSVCYAVSVVGHLAVDTAHYYYHCYYCTYNLYTRTLSGQWYQAVEDMTLSRCWQKCTGSCDVTPSGVVEIWWCFWRDYWLRILSIRKGSSSEMSTNFYRVCTDVTSNMTVSLFVWSEMCCKVWCRADWHISGTILALLGEGGERSLHTEREMISYLCTYLLHGADSFFGSQPVLS